VTRMATLATGGRITCDGVREEVARLEESWAAGAAPRPHDELLAEVLPGPALDGLDRFDRAQLAEVVRVCREARSLAAAGRMLFAASRSRRSSLNDSDRLRKYLSRFGLDFPTVSPRGRLLIDLLRGSGGGRGRCVSTFQIPSCDLGCI